VRPDALSRAGTPLRFAIFGIADPRMGCRRGWCRLRDSNTRPHHYE
jgi:hypothetical protein